MPTTCERENQQCDLDEEDSCCPDLQCRSDAGRSYPVCCPEPDPDDPDDVGPEHIGRALAMANFTVGMFNGVQHPAIDYSFSVRVRVSSKSGVNRCSGMVYKTKVLTSAHCFKTYIKDLNLEPPYKLDATKLPFPYVTDVSIGGGRWVQVVDIQIHNLYKREGDHGDHTTPDVAVLTLKSELEGLSADTKEWCVDMRPPRSCQKLIVAAYGPPAPGVPSHQNFVTVGLFNVLEADSKGRPYYWFMIGTQSGDGSLVEGRSGDSGAPVFREPGRVPLLGRRFRVKGLIQGGGSGEHAEHAKFLTYASLRTDGWWKDYGSPYFKSCV